VTGYLRLQTPCPFLSCYASILAQIRRLSSGLQFTRSFRNSDAGLTPVTNRRSRARVHAT
jgi:hypothetical protein